jgi:Ca2+-binding RTX toxin-like protein
VNTLPRGRVRRFAAGLVVPILLTWTIPTVAWAAPASQCTFDGVTGVVTVTVGDGLLATISRSGVAVAVDGVPCQMASVATTDLIEVVLPPASQAETVVVDLSGGPLAPGVTDEDDGSSEIEVQIDGVDDDFDELRITGSAGADALAVHAASANLNANEQVADEDVTIDLPTSIQLLGGEGDDLLSLPDLSPGDSFALSELQGGPGEDRLIGGMGASDIDGGPGRDTVDYSWVPGSVNLIWETDGAFVFSGLGEDDLVSVEVAILTDDHDTVVYQGDASGETRTGGSPDGILIFLDPSTGAPGERIVRAGPGGLDSLEFRSDADQPLTLDLSVSTVGGSWVGSYTGVDLLFGGDGDDRFRITERGTYPTLIGGDGTDVLAFRGATEGINVTLGQPTFGPRKWIEAFEVERVLGSDFHDVFLGPSGVADPVELLGFLGRDELRGGEGPDHLAGGEGPDILRGFGGADTLKGWLGDDVLRAGPGPDTLHGGPGADVCDGGPGNDSFTGC